LARPPLPPGSHGSISVIETRPKHFRARCRYRDLAGRSTWVERSAASKTAARRALLDAVTERKALTFDDARQSYAKFTLALDLYRTELARAVDDGRLRRTTAMRYESCLARIDDGLGALRIAELTTGRISRFLADLGRLPGQGGPGLSPDSRRLHRAVLGNVLRMLAEEDAVPSDLMAGLRRISGQRKTPRALTTDERLKILAWCDSDRLARERGMGDLVRFMLGTGARLGEALAVRWCDIDLDGVLVPAGDVIVQVPVVAITGNVVEARGHGVVRHPGKTPAARRVIPLPAYVAAMLRARRPADSEPWWPVFPAHLRTGEVGYRRPNLVQGWFREMRDAVGMPWLTSHVLRKTTATTLHDAGLPDRVTGGVTGHADLTTLLNVYIGRGELHPEAAAALDAAHVEPNAAAEIEEGS
jgi:integrase